ncbi:MAG TPA: DNA mismatch repair protein MutS [Thermoanaerobaculia bacterium]|nr:DNA mismatch repair protein MutS [Thermoanaerobaculia bacterium]
MTTASPAPADLRASAALTPMLRHYLEVKAAHPDAILMYRMGDFFELFFDDAVRAAPILEVALTARQKGTDNEAPMCGVPHHAVEGYIGKLLAAGLRVVICDQVEDPKEAKGLVRREVTRIVTPGTVSDPALLEGKEENLLAAVVWRGEEGAGALLEVSTGHFGVRRWGSPEQAADELEILRPRELLQVSDSLPAALTAWVERRAVCLTPFDGDRLLDLRRAAESLERHFGVATLRGFGLGEGEPAVLAAAAALAYVQDTQKSELAHVRTLLVEVRDEGLVLDPTTLANLEIFRTLREGAKRGTLLSVLDRTVTAPGGRLLKAWLRRPLRRPEAIEERLDAVAELVADAPRRERLRGLLAEVADGERLLARAVLGTLPPREAAALRDSLARVPELLAALAPPWSSRPEPEQGTDAPLSSRPEPEERSDGGEAEGSPLRSSRPGGPSASLGATSGLLCAIAAVDPLADLAAELARVLTESPSASVQDGDVIAPGVDPDLDLCRSLAQGSKQHILSLEAAERTRTGIPTLKIRYNKVFGYYLEVSHAHQGKVPPDYIRKQTLVNAERYVTPEIKELEEKILSAEERQLALEQRHYSALLGAIAREGERLSRLAEALAQLDVLAALAEVAARGRWVRPEIGPPGAPIRVREGRHPVVEAASREAFVPNDAELDAESAQIVLLTGPNMGGKSTYLRQVALLVLLAQLGSFVPAEAATIGVVDRIFSRVGASDDLARGESTFMVEMIETANILHQATDQSLVILDEVGRGTATFDGLSLAWAIVEHLHETKRPKTLFATHYHELTELAALLPRVVNRKMAVKEWQDRIVFLRRVVPGSADKSYGLQVARLAGLPASVIGRAGEILANLEAEEYDFAGRPRRARGKAVPAVAEAQMTLFTPPEQVVADILRGTDVDQLTPVAALNLLASLRSRLR